MNDSKEWLDAGYLDSNIKGQWNDDWNKSMGSQSKVFAFLLPAWGIGFVLNPNWDGESGNWAVTNPPQEYNWGGSYIHAATGTDNVKYAKDIILAMTSNQDNLLKISQDYSDFTNTKSGMAEAAKDDAQNGNGQDDQKTDTGNTSDPTADDQNKGDETPADSTTDPSNDANTSDGGNNGSTTTEVTLAVDDTVAESGLTFKSTESQQITVKNNSAQAVTVAASSTGAAPAVTIDPSEQEIPAGESATFTVTPAENLATDTPYPDNILFADQNNSDNKIIVPVNVTIPAPAVSNVTRDPKDGPDFGTLVDGYTELPASQTITLTNEGNADAVLSDAVSSTGAAQGQYFDITWQCFSSASRTVEKSFGAV